MYGVVYSLHLDTRHELKRNVNDPNMKEIMADRYEAYQCECWTKRLGKDWHLLIKEDEMAMLPDNIEVEPPDKLKRVRTIILDITEARCNSDSVVSHTTSAPEYSRII